MNYQRRSTGQFALGKLFVLLAISALAIQLWSLLGHDAMLMAWTVSCGIELYLLRRCWMKLPVTRAKAGYTAAIMALPASVVPILGCAGAVGVEIADAVGAPVDMESNWMPVLIMIVAWPYAAVAITASFFVQDGVVGTRRFTCLRIIALLNLVLPLLPGQAR